MIVINSKKKKKISLRNYHILGEFVGIVRDHVELELDSLILFMFIPPLFGIQNSETEIHLITPTGHRFIPRDDLNFQSSFFREKLVI